jgi:hypothetical protein
MESQSRGSRRRRGPIASAAGALVAATIVLSLTAAVIAPAAVARTRPRPRRFVTVTARQNHGSIAVTVALTANPDLRFAVTLNGKSVTAQFSSRRPLRRAAVLDAADGVRRGRNVVRVSAKSSGGRGGTASAAVKIARTQPLLANGSNLRGVPGRKLRAAGRLMTLIPAGARPSYRWTVLSKPRRSHVSLANPRSLTTALRPNRPGVYRLRLTARIGKQTAVDDLTDVTTANYPPLGTPVNTMADDGQAIQIGSQVYNFTDPPNGACNALNVVVLDRETSGVALNETLSGSANSATRFLGQVKTLIGQDQVNGNPLVIITDTLNNPEGPNCSNAASQWSQVVSSIAGEPIPQLSTGAPGGWSIIGTWQGSAGTAWQNDGSDQSGQVLAGGLDGYLQYNGVNLYSFVPSQRLPADLDAPRATSGQNAIELGSTTYPSGALPSVGGQACGTGGFQIVAVNAVSLALVSNQVFTTNGCGAQDSVGVDQMIGDLNGLAKTTNPAQLLVAVQSIGTPYDGGSDGIVWPLLDQAMTGVGGTPGVLAADQQGYSLLGGVGIGTLPLAEASQSVTKQPAHVTAVLERNNSWAYAPALSSSTGSFSFGLSLLAYQAPRPFAPSSGQLHALWYIDGYLAIPPQTTGTECYAPSQGIADVRYAYCNTDLGSQFSAWANTVKTIPYPAASYFKTHPNATFTKAQLTTVENQIGPSPGQPGEFEEVSQVDSVIKSLQAALGGQQGSALAIAGSEASNISAAVAQLNRKSNSFASGIALDLIGNLLTAIGAGTIADLADETKNAINTLSAATLIGEDIDNSVTGQPALGSFSVNVSDFKQMLATRYQQAAVSLQHLQALIVTDPDKLSAFWNNSATYSYQPSTGMTQATELAAAQFSWQALLPTAFELVQLQRGGQNSGVTDARQYSCTYEAGRFPLQYKPFPNAPLSSQLLNYNLYTLVENGSTLPDGDYEEQPKTPPATLTDPLFAPYAYSSGVITQFGLYKPWFYREAYGNANLPQVSNCGGA